MSQVGHGRGDLVNDRAARASTEVAGGLVAVAAEAVPAAEQTAADPLVHLMCSDNPAWGSVRGMTYVGWPLGGDGIS